jgi:hypothetical protein
MIDDEDIIEDFTLNNAPNKCCLSLSRSKKIEVMETRIFVCPPCDLVLNETETN